MEPLERNERVREGYSDMDARLMDDLGLKNDERGRIKIIRALS